MQVSALSKLAYAIGQGADGAKTSAFALFLFFYFNSVLGLGSALAGAAAMCALVADGITDPMVGAYSDRFRSRWGRRHPFMLAAIVPFIASSVLLFSPPEGLGQWGLFAWMVFGAIAVRLSLTLFFVPHLALGAEMSSDYHQRTKLIGMRTFFAYGGQILIAGVGFMVIFVPGEGYSNGLLNPDRYSSFAWFFGLAGAGMMAIATFSTWYLIPQLNQPVVTGGKLGVNPFSGLLKVMSVFRQQAFRRLFSAILTFMVIAGVSQTLLVNTATNVFFFDARQTGILVFTVLVGMVLAPVIAQFLSHGLDKKLALVISVVTGALLSAIPFLAYFNFELLSWSAADRLSLVFVANGLAQGFFIAYVILVDSMISDCIDVQELESGAREEGLFFAARSLATKASFGLGAFFAGLALELIDFPVGISEASQVPEVARDALAFLNAPVLAGLMALTGILVLRYPLNEAKHTQVVAEIAERKKHSFSESRVSEN